MALNDILYAGLANQTTAEVLSGDFILLATDRNALPNHPALFYAGDTFGTGSKVRKVPHAGVLGYDLPTPVAEGIRVVNSAWTTGATTLAVGRYAKKYSVSDIAKFCSSTGLLDPSLFGLDASMSHRLALTNAIAALMGGFSNTVGASGVDLSIANVLAALTLLEVGFQGSIAPGDAMGILHTVQGGDFRTALATLSGGALQWNTPPEMLGLMGNQFRGRYLDVDWFVSGYVPTANAGADRAGGIFVRGAVLWADESVVAESQDQINIGGKVLFERERDGSAAVTGYPSHSWFATGEGIDAFGVAVITDA